MHKTTEVAIVVAMITSTLAVLVGAIIVADYYIHVVRPAADESGDTKESVTSSESPILTATNATTANVTVPRVTAKPPVHKEPGFTVDKQEPKYLEGQFWVEIKISGTPLEYTPWSGDGAPFINLYYRFPDGRAWNDTGMLHNAYVQRGDYLGYDVCDQNGERFWKFDHTAVEVTEATNRSLVYWSEPMPDDPNQLLGGGENCYTRATVASDWIGNVCYEGDGEITPYHDEEVNNTTIRHVDYMDECWPLSYTSPLPP